MSASTEGPVIEDVLPKLAPEERQSGETSVSLADDNMFRFQLNILRVEFNRWFESPKSCWVTPNADAMPEGLRKAETELVSKAVLAGLIDVMEYVSKRRDTLDAPTVLKVARPALVTTFLLEGPDTFKHYCPTLHPVITCNPTYLIACDFLVHCMEWLCLDGEMDALMLSTFLGNDYASVATWERK